MTAFLFNARARAIVAFSAVCMASTCAWMTAAGTEGTVASGPAAGHSTHGESFNEGPRSAAYIMAGAGDVHLPVTCKNDQAQKFFDQGIGQLHGFWYLEAERSFRQAAAIDPDCAMAYWGMAMANINNAARARDFIKEAVKRKAPATLQPIESAWIDALAGYYQEPAKTKGDRKKILVADVKEMRKKFPDDLELKAFLAFFIYEHHIKEENATADKLLDEIFAQAPRHPAHHYRIHLLDTREPKNALASAAQCGPASPGIAHMWHMPGHIYSDLNRYADAAWQQEASARVDHAYMIRDRVMPFQIFNYMHNSEWLCRDLLLVGRAHDAMELAKNMIELPRHPSRGNGAFYGPSRLIDTLSQHQMWEEYLEMCAAGYLNDDLDADLLIRKLRYEGVAAAATHNTDRADRCIAKLQERRRAATTQPAGASQKSKKGYVSSTRPATRPVLERSATTRPVMAAAATRPSTRPAPRAADADRTVTDRLAAIDQAIDHIKAEKALIAGDAAKAAALFTSAKARKEHIALALLAAENYAKAEVLAAQAVADGKQQAYPLATQVLVLHGSGKHEEARKVFEALRKLSEKVDLAVEPYKSLSVIAPEFGYLADYRAARKDPGDLGERPPLDSLGPFRWRPELAPDWSARSAGNSSISLGDYRGKPVIVLFYLGHGCPHCIRQIHAFATMAKEFTAAGISLVAVGTDSPDLLAKTWSLSAEGGEAPAFPLASDAGLDIFRKYHCYDDFEKMALHGAFLIDGQGLIRWQDISYDPFTDAAFLLKESKRLLGQPRGG